MIKNDMYLLNSERTIRDAWRDKVYVWVLRRHSQYGPLIIGDFSSAKETVVKELSPLPTDWDLTLVTGTEQLKQLVSRAQLEEAEMSDYAIPKTLAACADRLYKTRESRLALARQVAVLEEREREITEFLLTELPRGGATGVAGKVGRVTIRSEDIPIVTDKGAFHEYLKKTGEFDLLQQRLASKAVKERWSDGKQVPGLGLLVKSKLSITKV